MHAAQSSLLKTPLLSPGERFQGETLHDGRRGIRTKK